MTDPTPSVEHVEPSQRALLPCPFCGGEASSTGRCTYSPYHEAWWDDGSRVTESFFVNCVKCGCTNNGMLGHRTTEDAIAAWNTRDTIALAPAGDGVREALEQAHLLIQEAKGLAGDGAVTDHLDFAEYWLGKIDEYLVAKPLCPPAPSAASGVTISGAIGFINEALRNIDLPALSRDDIEDVRSALDNFAKAEALAIAPSPEAPAGDGVPPGWVMVPREPTGAMYVAAEAVNFENEDEHAMAVNVWNAMLTAAPSAPPPPASDAAAVEPGLVASLYAAANPHAGSPYTVGEIRYMMRKAADRLAALSQRAGLDAGTVERRNNAILLASICQKARHSSASAVYRDDALRDAAEFLRALAAQPSGSDGEAGK